MAKNRKSKSLRQGAGEKPKTPTPSPSPDRNSPKGASSGGGSYKEDSLSPIMHDSQYRPDHSRSSRGQSDHRTYSVSQSQPSAARPHYHTRPGTPLTGPSSEEVARALAVLMEAMRAQNMPPPRDQTPPHTRHQRRKLDHDGGKLPSFRELEEWEEDSWKNEKQRKKNPQFLKGSSSSRPETHKSSSSASRPESTHREPETCSPKRPRPTRRQGTERAQSPLVPCSRGPDFPARDENHSYLSKRAERGPFGQEQGQGHYASR